MRIMVVNDGEQKDDDDDDDGRVLVFDHDTKGIVGVWRDGENGIICSEQNTILMVQHK